MKTIMIVEDEKSIRDELKTLLETSGYKVILLERFDNTLEDILKSKFDLLLLDINLPKMNGETLLKEFRKQSNIPVIMVTSRVGETDEVLSMSYGADDYITKPFNSKILLLKCNNLIRNRILLQQKYRHEPTSTVQLLASNETDKKFLQKVETVIETYLDSTEFSIDKLAEELTISRRSLFGKFKQLTGMTPNDFVLDYKLKKAASLLKKDNNLQIAEIADRLGFGSSRYFSRCFKKQYHVSPMEYRKDL